MEGEVPSSVTGNYTQLKDPLLLPQQPLSHHGNTIATSQHSVTTTSTLEQPRLSLPASLIHTTHAHEETPAAAPPHGLVAAHNVSFCFSL